MREISFIAISGFAGVGKTEFCKLVEERLGFVRISFGNLIEEMAKENNISADRDQLISFGKKLALDLGWDGFIKFFLERNRSHAKMVFDGIRDYPALVELRVALTGSCVPLLFLDADRAVRRQRLVARQRPVDQNLNIDAFQKFEEETDLPKLRIEANLIINAEDSLEVMFIAAEEFIKNLRVLIKES